MIQLLFGENAYAKQQAVSEFIKAAQKELGEQAIERFDGEQTDPKQLGNILQGASLFSSEKLVVINDASKNKTLWLELEKWVEAMPKGTSLILAETSPDKRTKTFKLLQKHAEVKELKALGESEAVKWLVTEAKKRGSGLTLEQAEQIVALAGTDQWRLSNELDKIIAHGWRGAAESLIEPSPQANVFALLDAVLHKKQSVVQNQLAAAKATEDPYMLFGLFSAQLLQLAALVYGGGRSPDDIAKALGSHPFPLKKLKSLSNRISPAELHAIIETVATLDDQLKSTGIDPWILLEQALIKIAARA